MHKSIAHLLALPLVVGPALVQAETVTKRVALEGIQHIHLVGTYDLTVSEGTDEYVEVTADSAVLDQIKAKTQGSKIVIGQDQDGWRWSFGDDGEDEQRRPDASFALQVREFHSLSNMGVGRVVVSNINNDEDVVFSNLGAGRIILRNISVDEVEFNNLGAGRIEVTQLNTESITENSTGAGNFTYRDVNTDKWEINSYGNADTTVETESRTGELDIDLKGAGQVDAERVIADKVKIDIAGAGTARVNVTDELDVSIEGVGKVYYRGSPEEIAQDLGTAGELIVIDQ